ncbi:hypothetical protein OH146_00900 [Salinibacterium sp. SYSU T00001]|uniref:type IV toxin-antitoxin system AbiEi family antitoxin n=1 Tax=Homoserinimonas sedimenticola TaxID=2986805 RepID=UPI0022355BBC|nr:type IV toxin-antitoxin system AbiEi family antitoxin [Salinibacterium sedimenticola]MCW4384325.1 hypothetical protein [Salinibacterium sedimenticola]
MPRLAPILTELDLPLPELHAARLDGEIYALGEGFASIDEFEQPHLRARSLASMIQPRIIAERATAAWIHGAIPRPPAIHELCVSLAARSRASASRRFVLREVVITPLEVQEIAGVAVTTPLRTAIDLIRDENYGVESERIIRQLLADNRLEVSTLRSEIETRYKLAGKRRALERVALIADPCPTS